MANLSNIITPSNVLTATNTNTVTNKTISGADNTLTNISLTAGVAGILPVANGGTGRATLTANNVVLGNGTSTVNFVAPSTNGNVLTSNGTTWTSAAPSAPSLISSAGAVGAYGLFYSFVATAIGGSVAGSNLRYAGGSAAGVFGSPSNTTPTGTWQLMSDALTTGGSGQPFGLLQRIA